VPSRTARSHDSCGDARDLEADFRKCPAEQPVLFIAPTTALPVDDLAVSIRRLCGQANAELNIDVLEGNALYMVGE
jgi:hypothetical protein